MQHMQYHLRWQLYQQDMVSMHLLLVEKCIQLHMEHMLQNLLQQNVQLGKLHILIVLHLEQYHHDNEHKQLIQ